MKNLIVYYSYEGNCDEISKAIQEVSHADVLKLTVKKENQTKSLMRFVWGGIQVYMTKKPELDSYHVDFNQYDHIFIGTPVWFGTYAPAINTFLSENKIEGKKISLFICSGNNKRNTFKDFENALKGNTIIDTIEFVYPIKNGIDKAALKAREWATNCLNRIEAKN